MGAAAQRGGCQARCTPSPRRRQPRHIQLVTEVSRRNITVLHHNVEWHSATADITSSTFGLRGLGWLAVAGCWYRSLMILTAWPELLVCLRLLGAVRGSMIKEAKPNFQHAAQVNRT